MNCVTFTFISNKTFLPDWHRVYLDGYDADKKSAFNLEFRDGKFSPVSLKRHTRFDWIQVTPFYYKGGMPRYLVNDLLSRKPDIQETAVCCFLLTKAFIINNLAVGSMPVTVLDRWFIVTFWISL